MMTHWLLRRAMRVAREVNHCKQATEALCGMQTMLRSCDKKKNLLGGVLGVDCGFLRRKSKRGMAKGDFQFSTGFGLEFLSGFLRELLAN
jgi:hypothetical protein